MFESPGPSPVSFLLSHRSDGPGPKFRIETETSSIQDVTANDGFEQFCISALAVNTMIDKLANYKPDSQMGCRGFCAFVLGGSEGVQGMAYRIPKLTGRCFRSGRKVRVLPVSESESAAGSGLRNAVL